jgi:serine/threonine protein kinase
MSQLKEQLSVICRSNHSSVVKLLGASISGDYIYLVYEFIPGANLSNCLRNSKNPNFTVLSVEAFQFCGGTCVGR